MEEDKKLMRKRWDKKKIESIKREKIEEERKRRDRRIMSIKKKVIKKEREVEKNGMVKDR